MKTESLKSPGRQLALLVAVTGCMLFAGCEDDGRGPQVYVGNDSAGAVTVEIDGMSVGALEPQEERPFGVTPGEHKVKILREDQTLIFEGSITLSTDQAAYYTVDSDEGVDGPVVWNTDISTDLSVDMPF